MSRRDGDVSVYRNQEGTDIIKSEFTLGPLSLEVTKTVSNFILIYKLLLKIQILKMYTQ